MTIPEHKKPLFVLERGKNLRKIARSDTKTPILCSKQQGLSSGRGPIGIGKHNRSDAYRKRCLPANHRARFKNTNTS